MIQTDIYTCMYICIRIVDIIHIYNTSLYSIIIVTIVGSFDNAFRETKEADGSQQRLRG